MIHKNHIWPFLTGLVFVLAVSLSLSLRGFNNPSFVDYLPSDNNISVHFSVDDCFNIFQDLTVNQQYHSIFDNADLAFLKDLHDEYGCVFSLYCFYSWDVETSNTLADMTDVFSDEFSQNSSWLKFGFHAKDASAYESLQTEEEVLYYEKTLQELIRITGSTECIDTGMIRLDRYCADAETIQALADLPDGPSGFLCSTTPERTSYLLSSEQMETMFSMDWYEIDGIYFTPTDIQLENIDSKAAFYDELGSLTDGQETVVIFTHEWVLDDKNVQKYMIWFAEWACQCGCEFGYPGITR